MLIGARSAAQVIAGERFNGAQVQVATDDGSAGHHGSVVDLVTEVGGADVFACGPTAMLQALIVRAQQTGVPRASLQVALETPMGCGIGTCLGCAAPRAGGGFLLACQDGPCVSADRLDWNLMRDAFHG